MSTDSGCTAMVREMERQLGGGCGRKAAREAAERNLTADPRAGNYDSFSAEPLEEVDDSRKP